MKNVQEVDKQVSQDVPISPFSVGIFLRINLTCGVVLNCQLSLPFAGSFIWLWLDSEQKRGKTDFRHWWGAGEAPWRKKLVGSVLTAFTYCVMTTHNGGFCVWPISERRVCASTD